MIFTIFEDQNYKSLFPLNLNRASFELRCGAFTNLERIENLLSSDDTVQLVVRDELVPLAMERFPNFIINPELLSPGIWLNGRGLWTEEVLKKLSPGKSYTRNGKVIALHNNDAIPLSDFHPYLDRANLVSTEIDIQFMENIWEGIFLQSDVITSDAKYFIEYNRGKIHPSVAIENGDNIFLVHKPAPFNQIPRESKSGLIAILGNRSCTRGTSSSRTTSWTVSSGLSRFSIRSKLVNAPQRNSNEVRFKFKGNNDE